MLSLCELERAARVLSEAFSGARVERWLQLDGERLVVTLYRRDPESGDGRKNHLLLSAAADVARVSELASAPKASSTRCTISSVHVPSRGPVSRSRESQTRPART